MSDLVAFLEARITEDELVAPRVHRALDEKSNGPGAADCCGMYESDDYGRFAGRCDCPWPARVLAECAAKRAIIELHQGGHECSVRDRDGEIERCEYIHEFWVCTTLQLLAHPYADHPDFQSEWATSTGDQR